MSSESEASSLPVSPWESARNILCVRLDSLGDVLMSTPAIGALKEDRADRRITLLTSPSGAAAARLVPEIDDVLVYEAPWMKHTSARFDPSPEYAMAELLRAKQFDAAVIFTVYSQSPLPAAFLCYMAGIPLRLAHCHENPYQLLTDWVKDPEPHERIRHEAQRQLDLVATVGARTGGDRTMSVRVPEGAIERVTALLAAAGLDLAHPWLVLHPGATAASRRYPAERYAEVVRRLVDESSAQVVLTGGEDEIELIDMIRELASGPPSDRHPAVISLAGLLDLGELAALLRLAPLLVSNNTGPVHIAAALGTPVVVLYALTNPQHTPWQTPSVVLFHDVPCKFCYKSVCPEGHHLCLRGVSPDRVLAAAQGFLAARDWPTAAEGDGRRTRPLSPAVPGPAALSEPLGGN
jgi:lipopolysaccharide heptosyltransferase II